MAAPQTVLSLTRVSLSSVMLVYSSFKDLRTREVSNWTWIAFAPLGLVLNIYEVIYVKAVDPVFSLLIPILISSGMSVAFFYAGLYGGADAKAFITLSLLVPHPLEAVAPYLGIVSLFFPLTVLTDSVLIAGLSALSLLTRNLLWSLRVQRRLFEGLEEEPLWKKTLALLSCMKVEAERLRGPPYQYPAEVVVGSRRRLRLLPDTSSDEEALASLETLTRDLGLTEVWITPTLPFLLFISLGFFCSLILGDVVLWALKRIF